MRAAYINMTDVNDTCPQALNYTVVSSTRMCSRSLFGVAGCTSVTYPTHGIPYTKVCGRARGYQFEHTGGFYNAILLFKGLEDSYVSGVSVINGSPRNHIWTFAAGYSKDYSYGHANCPCAHYPGPASPSFVGESYFCESGNLGMLEREWSLDDPLWDSQGCGSGSNCCNRGGPWFTTTLNQEVSDDIEMRLCHTEVSRDVQTESTGVEQLEIFIY